MRKGLFYSISAVVYAALAVLLFATVAKVNAAIYFFPGGFNPISLSPALWLEADLGVSHTSNAVDTWADQSGNGKNATGSGTARPTYSTNQQNGLPGIYWDGSNDCMTVASLALDGYQTIFVVGRFTTAKDMFIEHSPTIGSNQGGYLYGEGNHGFTVNRASLMFLPLGTNWMGANTAQVDFRYNGTNATVFKDGSSVTGTTQGSAGDTSTTQNLYIGARNCASLYQDGYLFSLIYFSAPLSDADRASVRNWQKTKWATP